MLEGMLTCYMNASTFCSRVVSSYCKGTGRSCSVKWETVSHVLGKACKQSRARSYLLSKRIRKEFQVGYTRNEEVRKNWAVNHCYLARYSDHPGEVNLLLKRFSSILIAGALSSIQLHTQPFREIRFGEKVFPSRESENVNRIRIRCFECIFMHTRSTAACVSVYWRQDTPASRRALNLALKALNRKILSKGSTG